MTGAQPRARLRDVAFEPGRGARIDDLHALAADGTLHVAHVTYQFRVAPRRKMPLGSPRGLTLLEPLLDERHDAVVQLGDRAVEERLVLEVSRCRGH